MKKYKNKNTGKIVVANTSYEENIISSNPNYALFEEKNSEVEETTEVKKKTQKVAK